MERSTAREGRVREIKNWLQLSFLCDRVHVQLRQLLLSKLEKLYGREWDGSPDAISLLKNTLRTVRRNLPRTVCERVDNGDIVNWDLQAVSFVLQSLTHEWVSPDEKQQTAVAVEVRNYLAHHPNRIVPEEEFSKNWEAQIGVLDFFGAPSDLIQNEIKFQASDIASLCSPSVLNQEANKLKKEGNHAFSNADYERAVEKYEEAMKVIVLKESERSVLLSNRSAALLHLATSTQDDEQRKSYARQAKIDAKRATELQPMWVKAFFRLGNAYEMLEKYNKAMEAYEEALSLEPNSKISQKRRNNCRAMLARHPVSDHLPPMKIDMSSVEEVLLRMKRLLTKEMSTEGAVDTVMENCEKSCKESAIEDVYKGMQHRDGRGTPVNYELAAKYFSKAAASGNAQAMYELARIMQEGKVVQRVEALALGLYEKTAKMPPDLTFGPNVGVREAMHALGYLQREGVCVNKSNSKLALEWYQRAADLGYGPSANNLGNMYSKGEGGIPCADPDKALKYWKIAARDKCVIAMRSIAHHYLEQKDVSQARDWINQALESGLDLSKAEQQEFEARCVQEETNLSVEAAKKSERLLSNDKLVENGTEESSEHNSERGKILNQLGCDQFQATRVNSSKETDNKNEYNEKGHVAPSLTTKMSEARKTTMEERVREMKHWLQLSFLTDRVTVELRTLLLSKLEVICGDKWDGSPKNISLLKETMGEKQLNFAGQAIRDRINKGDICNWDLTAVSFVLRSLSVELVSSDGKQQMEATVKIRNFLNHHHNKIVQEVEFSEKWDVLIGVLKFFKVPTDLTEKEIREHAADVTRLYSPSVMNQEANSLTEQGNKAFKNAQYEIALKKYDEAMRISTLKDADRGCLFCSRSAVFLQLAKNASNEEQQKFYAKRAENDAKRAAQLQPMWAEAFCHLGDAYEVLEKYDKAVGAYNEALALDPSSNVIKARRDDCCLQLHDRQRLDKWNPMRIHPTSKDEYMKHMNRNRKNQGLTQKQIEFVHSEWRKMGDEFGRVDVFEGFDHCYGIGTPLNYELAAECFSRAAAKGNALATYELAKLMDDGKGVQKNHKLAMELYHKAAAMPPDLLEGLNNGVRDAMHTIGLRYQYGLFVEKNYMKAFQWYKRAADLGFGPSANNLAVMYSRGQGGIPHADMEKAVQYWKLAARHRYTRSMIQLAYHFFVERDEKQARAWMKWAAEGGDVVAIAQQEDFEEMCLGIEQKTRPLQVRLETELGRPKKDTESIEDLEEAVLACKFPERLETKKEVDAIIRRGISASPCVITKLEDYLREYDLGVISKYADEGRAYAQQILKALHHFHTALYHLKLYESARNAVDVDTLIDELGRCLETASPVVRLAGKYEDLIMELVKRKMGEYKNTPCQMDIYSRVCYTHFRLAYYEENVLFLKKCIAKYPRVIYFHNILAGTYGLLKQYPEGLEVVERALVTFPDNGDLLYSKASLARLAYDRTKGKPDQEIQNYNKFLKHAPEDHRDVPNVYYSIAKLLVDYRGYSNYEIEEELMLYQEVKMYYQKGLRSEEQLIPCFLPYKSDLKDWLRLMVEAKQSWAEPSLGPLQQRALTQKVTTRAQDGLLKNRLTDPCRTITILDHRQVYNTLCHIAAKQRHLDFTTVQPQFEQKAPNTLDGLKNITFLDMNPAADKVYKNCVLDVVVIEDPLVPMPSIHVVLEDKKGEVFPGYFYNVKGDPRIKYGAKISITNPYLRIGAEDDIPGIRVDDPKSLLIHHENGSNRCRYCGSRDSKFYCIKCKRKYCSNECRTLDLDLLEHKLICGLKLVEPLSTETIVL